METKKLDLDRHVWEGWTPRAFIEELIPEMDMIMNGESFRKPFQTKVDIAKYTAENQPYYKKQVPEVVSFFCSRYGIN